MSTFLAGCVKGINWIWEILDLTCQVIANIELMMVKNNGFLRFVTLVSALVGVK